MFTFNLTTEQFHAMRQLIDVGIKAVGLDTVTPETLALRQMIETAKTDEQLAAEKEAAEKAAKETAANEARAAMHCQAVAAIIAKEETEA